MLTKSLIVAVISLPILTVLAVYWAVETDRLPRVACSGAVLGALAAEAAMADIFAVFSYTDQSGPVWASPEAEILAIAFFSWGIGVTVLAGRLYWWWTYQRSRPFQPE